MFKKNKSPKYMKLEDVRVFYDEKDGSIHLTSKDKNLPKGKGFHLTLNQGRAAENTLREMLVEQGFIGPDKFDGMPTPLSLDHARPASAEWCVPLGRYSAHEEAIWDMRLDPHMVLLGHTGSGKSVVMRNIMFHCFQHPDRFDAIFISPVSSVEIAPYEKMSPVLKDRASNLYEINKLMVSLNQTMNSRYAIMEEEGVNDFTHLQNPPKRTVLFIDEAFTLSQQVDELRMELSNGRPHDYYAQLTLDLLKMINNIARLGRAAGIHLVVSSQRPDGSITKRTLENQNAACISMGRIDYGMAKDVLRDENAFKINGSIRGRGYFKKTSQAGEFQSYYADMDWFARKNTDG